MPIPHGEDRGAPAPRVSNHEAPGQGWGEGPSHTMSSSSGIEFPATRRALARNRAAVRGDPRLKPECRLSPQAGEMH